MAELVQLDALGYRGPYRAHRRVPVPDVTGMPIADLSLVPRLFVQRSLAALRSADTLPTDERVAALGRAGRAFASSVINGLSGNDYQHIVSRVSGLPISVVRASTRIIVKAAVEAYFTTQYARPSGSVNDWRDPATRHGCAVWTRRGDVFAVHAAGNHPGVHALWLEALAMGYRVAVRPSRREPFTPHRLVTALRDLGFPDDHVVLLPTDHAIADDIVGGADLAMVYGGDDVVNKYRGHNTVLPQGPGRSKILIADGDWREHLDLIVDSIVDEGGAACINATAVFVEGDHTTAAEAIAERLSNIPSLPPDDDKAVLPAQPLATARALETFLLRSAEGTTAWLGGDGVVDDLGDGSAVLRPAVFQVHSANAWQTGIELGFPCVWVAPWSRGDGIEPLKNTLVLTAVTEDRRLIERLVAEPSIGNVYLGDYPTYWMQPGLPHDGYLAEFLMRTKAVVRN